MKLGRVALLLAATAFAGEAMSASPAGQVVTGPVAVYWMSATTSSGMGAMMGGGGRPSMADIMAMRSGGGQSFSHNLVLQLGSSRRPTDGSAAAEHDPPAALGAGAMLPLVSPQPQAAPTHQEAEPGPPPQYHQPKGRMLIFWGCGEHAAAGQPLVIDFAQLGQGGAQQFMALTRGLALTPMQPPSPGRNTTYGEWPNTQSSTTVPPQGSLQGQHHVHGNYSPDINFSLAADQDFLPPIQLTTNAKNPSGSATLAWRTVDGARAYFANMFGAQSGGDVVMWTSSESQASAFALPDYLSDHDITRLVENHALLPATQNSCIIPQEAVAAAGHAGIFRLAAYGGETNIAYPPRPPAPQPWNIAWEVKVRYRSTTGGLLGMDLSRMGRGGDSNPQQQPQQQPARRPSPFNPLGGLGGLIPHN